MNEPGAVGMRWWRSAGDDVAPAGAMTGRAGVLPAPLSGERRGIDGRAGPLTYYVAGSGPPLLLIHSINAAGSAYEIRPIFERSLTMRRTYAVDLPGFGASDRSDRGYTPRLFTDALQDMVDVIAAEHGPVPVDALAVSLSSEFLARAALERPERWRSLTLVTPTGFSRGSDKLRGPAGSTREVPGLYPIFTCRLWTKSLYNLLVSRTSIRYFLKRTYGSERIDEDLLDYDYLTTHQPGARHAPYAFVSGRLFSRDARSVYEALRLPVWVPHAMRGDFKDFSEAGWAKARGNWTFQPYPVGALVHFELPDVFQADFERFLAHLGGVRKENADQSSRLAPSSPSP